MSGYSNLCVYFLVKSMNELNENGKCCYIIPYEFMNTGYGKGIKQYLLDSKMLKTMAKKYINAELQIVRMNNRDIVTDSMQLGLGTATSADAPDRFRDFEDYSY